MTLTEFLLARITEDEAVARDAVIPAHDASNAYKPHPELAQWRFPGGYWIEADYDDPGPHPEPTLIVQEGDFSGGLVDIKYGYHIARHDPARVLAECETRRRIVLEAADLLDSWEHIHDGTVGLAIWPDVSRRERSQAFGRMALLAEPYANHADYDEAWRP